MKFLGKETKLVIFDLDGTLIASTSLWSDVDHAFFSKRKMDIPSGYGRAIAHLGLSKAAEYTVKNYFPNEKEEDILKEWNDLALKEYKYNIPLKENARIAKISSAKKLTAAEYLCNFDNFSNFGMAILYYRKEKTSRNSLSFFLESIRSFLRNRIRN